MRRAAILFLLFFLLVPAPAVLGGPSTAQPADRITLTFAGDILLDGFVGSRSPGTG